MKLELSQYYQTQLKKLGNIRSGYPAKFKITSDHGETKWISLNDESALILIDMLSDNFNIKNSSI